MGLSAPTRRSVKLKLNCHAELETPLGDCHANLEVIDEDDDNDPEIRLKWNLPGKALDSGPEGVKIEIPLKRLVVPVVKMLTAAATAAGVPAPVAAVLGFVSMSVGSDD